LAGDGVVPGPAGATGVAQHCAMARTRSDRFVVVAGTAALAAAARRFDLADDNVERHRLHTSQLTQEREEQNPMTGGSKQRHDAWPIPSETFLAS